MPKTICIIGTLDTKGHEFQFLKDRIEASNALTITINVGILGEPFFEPNITADQIAIAGGSSLEKLRSEADRGNSVTTMAIGAEKIVKRLFTESKIDGVISLGGSAGTTIATTAMRSMPVGFPKVMVSTLASGDVGPYVGTKDLTMIYPVVDIAGLNSISRPIIANAAAAIVGMVNADPISSAEDRPLISATMFGVTTPCVTKAREILENAGYEVLVFHATGTGGRAMEDLIRDGFIVGVLDVTTTELVDELVNGILSAGPDRLTAAGQKGIPQIVVPGALDMANFGSIDTIPEKFKDRTFYRHNPNVTLMRTTTDENTKLGEVMAQKLNSAKGPTTVIVPKKGVSAIDLEDQPFHFPEANTAWLENLKSNLDHEKVELIETDLHINDPEFSEVIAKTLISKL